MEKISNGVILSEAEYARLIKKKKGSTSNVILALLGLALLAFIVTMIVTFWKYNAVPDTLIQYTLGAGGVEALVLAAIKISKVCKGEQKATKESEE